MSRSYKKHPVLKDSSTNHRDGLRPKAIANRIVRRQGKNNIKHVTELTASDDLLPESRTTYKRQTQSYNIYDFVCDLYEARIVSPKLHRLYYNK